jgi:predicted nucleic acid-binding Zn ribbon protein
VVACPNCGTAIPADAKFCANCGTPVPESMAGGNGEGGEQTMYQVERSGDPWES